MKKHTQTTRLRSKTNRQNYISSITKPETPLKEQPTKNSESLIINTLLKLKASGLKKSSLLQISWILKRLNEHSDLMQLGKIKLYIANQTVANSYKENMVKAYNYFCIINQIEWNRPKYRFESKKMGVVRGILG